MTTGTRDQNTAFYHTDPFLCGLETRCLLHTRHRGFRIRDVNPALVALAIPNSKSAFSAAVFAAGQGKFTYQHAMSHDEISFSRERKTLHHQHFQILRRKNNMHSRSHALALAVRSFSTDHSSDVATARSLHGTTRLLHSEFHSRLPDDGLLFESRKPGIHARQQPSLSTP